jgi:hypothetical protein
MTDPDERPDPRLRDLNAPVLNPLPGVVWALLLAVGGVEAVLILAGQGWIGGAAGIGWRLAAIQQLAFAADMQGWMIENRAAPARLVLRYVAYPWVQAAPPAAGLALVMLAALGKAVAEGQGARVVLAVALLVPPLAAAVFAVLAPAGAASWLIGAMPLVFGLVGAFTFGLWARAADARARRRAFGLIGVLMLARLVLGLMVEVGPGWIADLAAFALGLGLAAVLAPGALGRIAARLRRR